MTIVDTRGGRYQAQTTPTGKTLWVDSEKGNDSVARRGFMTVPFLTLAAAKNAAASGDTIVVLPGSYTTTEQLAKDGVNWHFMSGAVVAPASGFSSSGLFEVSSSAMTFMVTGHGMFDVGAVSKHLLYVNAASSEIYFEAYWMFAGKTVVKVSQDSNVIVKADWIFADEECGIDLSTGTVSVTARRIDSANSHGVKCTGGTLELDAGRIYVISGGTNGVLFSGGTARIRAVEIYAEGSHAVQYTSSGSVTIQNARLVSNYNNSAAYAVYASGGSSGITLHNCVLLVTGASATKTIAAAGPGAFTVQFHGICTANKTIGSNITYPTLAMSPTGFCYPTSGSIT